MSNVLGIAVFGFVLVFGSWLVGGFFFKRLIADVSFPSMLKSLLYPLPVMFPENVLDFIVFLPKH